MFGFDIDAPSEFNKALVNLTSLLVRSGVSDDKVRAVSLAMIEASFARSMAELEVMRTELLMRDILVAELNALAEKNLKELEGLKSYKAKAEETFVNAKEAIEKLEENQKPSGLDPEDFDLFDMLSKLPPPDDN